MLILFGEIEIIHPLYADEARVLVILSDGTKPRPEHLVLR